MKKAAHLPWPHAELHGTPICPHSIGSYDRKHNVDASLHVSCALKLGKRVLQLGEIATLLPLAWHLWMGGTWKLTFRLLKAPW